MGGSLGWAEAARVLGASTGLGVAAIDKTEVKYFHSLPTGSAMLPVCNSSFKN